MHGLQLLLSVFNVFIPSKLIETFRGWEKPETCDFTSVWRECQSSAITLFLLEFEEVVDVLGGESWKMHDAEFRRRAKMK